MQIELNIAATVLLQLLLQWQQKRKNPVFQQFRGFRLPPSFQARLLRLSGNLKPEKTGFFRFLRAVHSLLLMMINAVVMVLTSV